MTDGHADESTAPTPRAIGVIPARMDSTRLPGKALADATGRALVLHVLDRAREATRLERVLVATDDDRIAAAVRADGGHVVMTRSDHENGTSRVAEVAAGLDPEIGVVVNIQGDEPEIDPAHVDLAVEALASAEDCAMSTLACPLGPPSDLSDPAVVKVVRDVAGRALYFSRSPIPHLREPDELVAAAAPLRHVGLYAYRRAFLPIFAALPATPLERSERLEQLRAIEHGHRIAVALVDASAPGIDTPAQYAAFVARTRGA